MFFSFPSLLYPILICFTYDSPPLSTNIPPPCWFGLYLSPVFTSVFVKSTVVFLIRIPDVSLCFGIMFCDRCPWRLLHLGPPRLLSPWHSVALCLCDETTRFRVAFYCDKSKTNLCTSHIVLSAYFYVTPVRLDYLLHLHKKSFEALTSNCEKCMQKTDLFIYFLVCSFACKYQSATIIWKSDHLNWKQSWNFTSHCTGCAKTHCS